MTQVFFVKSQNIAFALDWRVPTRLAFELETCGIISQAKKISRLNQKKGG